MSETAETLLALGYEARRERRPNEAKQFFADAISLSRADSGETTLAKAVTGANTLRICALLSEKEGRKEQARVLGRSAQPVQSRGRGSRCA